MTDDLNEEVPDSVRKIIEALVSQALARCDEHGISREDFYRAMLEEQAIPPHVSVQDLFERVFRRLLRGAN